jgi:hypothetical protein
MIHGTERRRPPPQKTHEQVCALLAAWPAQPQEFERQCQNVADWSTLLAEIERHGVLGILARALLESGVQLRPEVRAHLEERRTVERLWARRLNATLGEALAALEGEAVHVLPLKGPVLSERLYADPLARLSTDLDLLVHEEDFARARQVLESLGYQSEQGPAARYLRRYHHHISLTAPHRPTIELHFRAYVGFGTTIPATALLASASPYRTADGHACLVAAAEDEFIYLCIHAAGHDFQRLAWLYDLKTFLERHPQVQPATALARARSRGVAVAVAFTLEILRRRLGVTQPPGPWRPTQTQDNWRAAAWLLARLEDVPPDSARARLASMVLQALLCDRISASMWFLQHHLSRIMRRKLQHALPGLFPTDWSA